MPAPHSVSVSQHRVILSWSTSPSPQKGQDAAVGYCLYRSKKQNAAERQPTCSQCEQINLVPVTGTTCVDDLVENNAMYYYVVTAVNGTGTSSNPSNEVSVRIADDKKSKPAPTDAPPVPSCRAGSTRVVLNNR